MRKIIPASGALAEMLARDAEHDSPLGGWGGELATPGPPEPQAAPLPPLRLPEPDWQAEAKNAQRENGKALSPSPRSTRAQRSKRRRKTAHLDEVRAWRQEDQR